MKFEEFGVKPEIVRALKEMEIVEPTGIQEKAIPIIRSGRDLIGMSKTGSGKTAAFGIPTLEILEKGQGVQLLVMAPTRELALQISKEMEKFGKYLDYSVTVIFGGVAIDPQVKKIKQSEIVIGTPGRLLDHIRRGTLNLSKIKCVVLDEADKMVDMGFIQDIKKILGNTPRTRQTLLFGATLSKEINGLKKQYMNNPLEAKAETHVKEDLLEQYYYNVRPQDKLSLLVHLLKTEKTDRVIVFCSTINNVEMVSKSLKSQDIKNEKIHGKLSQNRRLQNIGNFNEGKTKILVASAVAARGLDIKDVSHVFNYDLSQDPQEYVHRVGRTARAGESGKAITLLSERDHDAFRNITGRYDVKVNKLETEYPRLKFAYVKPQNFNNSYNRFNQRRFNGRSNSHRSNKGRFNGGRKFNGSRKQSH